MEQVPQSEQGTGWSLPIPQDLQQPLPAHVNAIAQSGSSSAIDKSSIAVPSLSAPTDSHAKFSEEVHNYVREYIRNADQKATFFFAALTAMLAFLNTQNVPGRWLKDIRLWSFIDTLGFISMCCLALGAGILLAVVFPRLKGSKRGLLFFNAIAKYESSAEYAEDVLVRSGDYLVRTKIQHCYDLSKVCSAKYRLLRFGFWIGSIGAVTALMFLLLAEAPVIKH